MKNSSKPILTVYMDSNFNPASKAKATLVKVLYANGRAAFYRPKGK